MIEDVKYTQASPSSKTLETFYSTVIDTLFNNTKYKLLELWNYYKLLMSIAFYWLVSKSYFRLILKFPTVFYFLYNYVSIFKGTYKVLHYCKSFQAEVSSSLFIKLTQLSLQWNEHWIISKVNPILLTWPITLMGL